LKEQSFKKKFPDKGQRITNRQQDKSFFDKGLFNVLGVSFILLLGSIIYSNSLKCSFHFDDLTSIVNNTAIRNLSDVKAWMNVSPTRPVGMLSFALNYHFFKLDVYSYHIVNLILHLLNSCLVWWFIMLLFSSPALKDKPVSNHKNIIALFVALLFVSHPLATQSVTYIVQRQNLLAAFFYLLSLSFYAKARISDIGKTSKFILFGASFLSGFLALFSKENAFTLPITIILFEAFFVQTKKIKINFKDYRVILFFLAMLCVIIIIPQKWSFNNFNSIRPYNGNLVTITPLNYLFTQFSVIVKYIQLLLLPFNQNLDPDFHVSNSLFEIKTLICFLFLLVIIALSVFFYKKQRIFSFGILWFFITLSVESSFIPLIDVFFEHRTYLPSVGYFLILVMIIYSLLWKKSRIWAIGVFAIILGVNSFLTFQRNKVWKNDLTLWTDVVSKSPGKARPYVNLGITYGDLHDYEKSLTYLSKAIEINPVFLYAYWNRGLTYDNMNQPYKAIADYSKAIEINPQYTDAYYNRGITYGKLEQWANAIADYSMAIAIDPNCAKAYNNRGVVYDKLLQWNKSVADYSSAIMIEGTNDKAFSNRGFAYLNIKQWDKAIDDFSKAIEINPKNVKAYNNRGIVYGNLRQWDKAVSDFLQALQVDPGNAEASYNLDIANQKKNNGAN